MAARYLKNPFPVELPPILSADELWERVKPLLVELDECELRGAVPRSTGQYQRHHSIYTGLGGVEYGLGVRALSQAMCGTCCSTLSPPASRETAPSRDGLRMKGLEQSP